MTEEQRQEMMRDPEKWLKIVAKDGKLTAFKMTRFQRALWSHMLRELKDGKTPQYSMLMRGRSN